MRPVGIILVFLNLLFSVATCALIVVVYSTRANWKKEYDNAKATAELTFSAYKTEKQARENDAKSVEERLSAQKSVIETQKNTIAAAEAAKAQALAEFDKYKNATNNTDTQMRSLAEQVKNLQKEGEAIQKEKADLQGKIIELQGVVNDERKNKMDAIQKYEGLKVRNERLLAEYSDMTRRFQELERVVKGGGSRSILDPNTPAPPKGVSGVITEVSNTGLVSISIGTDSGLNVGNTLDVVRPDNVNPLKSIYLGKMTITRSEAKQAIGQFVAAPTSSVKLPSKGDEVLTSLSRGK